MFDGFVGYDFQTKNLNEVPILSAVFSGNMHSFVPCNIDGKNVDLKHRFYAYKVVVRYLGNLIESGCIKVKKTSNVHYGKRFIGNIRCVRGTTEITYVFKVPEPLGGMDVENTHMMASLFYSTKAANAIGKERDC